VQFLIAATIGAAVGALAALALLPWVRGRLARIRPASRA
jgi:gas vesicle protein